MVFSSRSPDPVGGSLGGTLGPGLTFLPPSLPDGFHLLQVSSLPISQVELASPSPSRALQAPVTPLTPVFTIPSHLVPPLCAAHWGTCLLRLTPPPRWLLPTPPASLTQLTSAVGSQADGEGRSPGCVQQVGSAQEEDGERDIAAQGGQEEVQDRDHSLTPQQVSATSAASQSRGALPPAAAPTCLPACRASVGWLHCWAVPRLGPAEPAALLLALGQTAELGQAQEPRQAALGFMSTDFS